MPRRRALTHRRHPRRLVRGCRTAAALARRRLLPVGRARERVHAAADAGRPGRPAVEAWIERWPTPAALAAEPPAEAVRAWDRLGYPRGRCGSTAAPSRSSSGTAARCRPTSTRCSRCRVSARTPRARSPRSPSDSGIRSSTPTRAGSSPAPCSATASPGPPSTARDLAAMAAAAARRRRAARRFNAGAMELGATVCTARAPALRRVPDRRRLRMARRRLPRLHGARKAVQARFEGSDRQVRGLVMRELRAAHRPVTRAELEPVWADAARSTGRSRPRRRRTRRPRRRGLSTARGMKSLTSASARPANDRARGQLVRADAPDGGPGHPLASFRAQALRRSRSRSRSAASTSRRSSPRVSRAAHTAMSVIVQATST